ncbi:hypothetical protein TNCV_862951 [Trichonephila clavipes]|nr:hypothetical protein TNCV_862951 [Trichonephila clavipes]
MPKRVAKAAARRKTEFPVPKSSRNTTSLREGRMGSYGGFRVFVIAVFGGCAFFGFDFWESRAVTPICRWPSVSQLIQWGVSRRSLIGQSPIPCSFAHFRHLGFIHSSQNCG